MWATYRRHMSFLVGASRSQLWRRIRVLNIKKLWGRNGKGVYSIKPQSEKPLRRPKEEPALLHRVQRVYICIFFNLIYYLQIITAWNQGSSSYGLCGIWIIKLRFVDHTFLPPTACFGLAHFHFVFQILFLW